jgi:hypothetical protein
MEAALLERRQQRGGDTIGEDGALASSGVAGGRAYDAIGAHWRMGARWPVSVSRRLSIGVLGAFEARRNQRVGWRWAARDD